MQNDKPRVLVFAISSFMGGIESFMLNYCNRMTNVIFDFIIIGDNKKFVKKINTKSYLYYVPCKSKNPIGFYKELKRIFQLNRNYQAVWFNGNDLADIYVLKLAKMRGIPIRICHAHNSEHGMNYLRRIRHTHNQNIIGQLVTNKWACSVNSGKWFYKESGYSIIPNSIEPKPFKYNETIDKEIRSKYHLNGKFVVGHVGRFTEQKNHDFILKIFFELKRYKPESVLMLIGTGPLDNVIKDRIQSLGLQDDVLLLGERADVSKLLSSMDLFLMPSIYEGFPVSLIEAQAAGLPCLVSDCITNDVNITNNVHFISLNQSPRYWVNTILDLNSKPYSRCEMYDIVCHSNYNINVSSKKLEDFFCANTLEMKNKTGEFQ